MSLNDYQEITQEWGCLPRRKWVDDEKKILSATMVLIKLPARVQVTSYFTSMLTAAADHTKVRRRLGEVILYWLENDRSIAENMVNNMLHLRCFFDSRFVDGDHFLVFLAKVRSVVAVLRLILNRLWNEGRYRLASPQSPASTSITVNNFSFIIAHRDSRLILGQATRSVRSWR